MRVEMRTSKPARPKSAASCCTRAESLPCGSPMIKPRPIRCVAIPGAAVLTAACTTQPTTRVDALERTRTEDVDAGREPPWHAVHGGQRHGVRAEERREGGRKRRQRV